MKRAGEFHKFHKLFLQTWNMKQLSKLGLSTDCWNKDLFHAERKRKKLIGYPQQLCLYRLTKWNSSILPLKSLRGLFLTTPVSEKPKVGIWESWDKEGALAKQCQEEVSRLGAGGGMRGAGQAGFDLTSGYGSLISATEYGSDTMCLKLHCIDCIISARVSLNTGSRDAPSRNTDTVSRTPRTQELLVGSSRASPSSHLSQGSEGKHRGSPEWTYTKKYSQLRLVENERIVFQGREHNWLSSTKWPALKT